MGSGAEGWMVWTAESSKKVRRDLKAEAIFVPGYN
jgi:hypothetical protein